MSRNFVFHQVISILLYLSISVGMLYFFFDGEYPPISNISLNLLSIVGLIALGYSFFEGVRFILSGIKGISQGNVEAWGTGTASWDYQFFPDKFRIYRKRYSIKGTNAQIIGINWISLGAVFIILPLIFFLRLL